MKIKTIIKLLFLLILIIVIGIEVFLRLNWDKLYIYATTPLIYQPDSTLGFTFKPNTKFYKEGKCYKINSQGFIGDEFSIAKKDGTYRIAFVGDCFISGAFSYQGYSNCCTTIQELFNQNHWNVEIYNCGLDGNDRSFEILQSINQIIKYNPDLIICEYVLPLVTKKIIREIYRNYIIEYSKDDKITKEELKSMVDNIYKFKYFLKIIDNIYIIKALCIRYINYRKYIESNNNSTSDNDYSNIKKTYLETFLELYIRKKDHPVKNILDIFENEFYIRYSMKKSLQLSNDIANTLKSKNIGFYYFTFYPVNEKETKSNIAPILKLDYDFDETMLYDVDHLNSKGNKALGEEFYRVLTKNKIIPEIYLKK